eukprot:GFKZ01008272.1.p1 GENE.GFKZ01008272.1~~GFKZ01008272.1.p1  ORF type:complete len:611 (+),score=33.88 GFKZ01008272.1:57-1835(+)
MSSKLSSHQFHFGYELLRKPIARLTFLVLILLIIYVYLFVNPLNFKNKILSAPFKSFFPAAQPVFPLHPSSLREARLNATCDPRSWYNHLLSHSPNHTVTTKRLACREYRDGAQACTFEGFICANTTAGENDDSISGPHFYFLDDTQTDGVEPRSDLWCRRPRTSDPRYYGASAHWPIRPNTTIPQQSCLRAYYRHSTSVLGPNPSTTLTSPSVLWLPSAIWPIHLIYNFNHNFHVFIDTIWMLDVRLFQSSMQLNNPPDQQDPASVLNFADYFFSDGPQHVYIPQSREQFEIQTENDLTRFVYALTLDLDPLHLYPNQTRKDLHTPQVNRLTVPFLTAYPDLERSKKILFHHELVRNPNIDLVCAPRLTAGPKQPSSGHERVCRELRKKGWDFFGLKMPEMKRVGRLLFPQPPRKIVLLNRHRTRQIENFDELVAGVRDAFESQGIEVEALTTKEFQSVETQVRVFGGAGVVITPHGGQCQALIWMPRHSALIEIFPVGYTEYSYIQLTEMCRVSHYEVRSEMPTGMTAEDFLTNCTFEPVDLDRCITYRNRPVRANVGRIISVTSLAFQRMAYPVKGRFKGVEQGGLLGM